MTTRTPLNRAARAALFAALALGVAAAGYALPAPTQPALFGRLLPPDGGIHPRAVLTRPDTTPVLEISEVDVKPVVLNAAEVVRAIEAAYPPALKESGRRGMVVVEMVVRADGTPSLIVPASDPTGFQVAAYTAARRMRFRPAQKGGVPVAVRLSVPISFTPSGDQRYPVSTQTTITTTVRTDTVVVPDGSGVPVMPAQPSSGQARILNQSEVGRAIEEAYPPLLRDAGVGGTVQLDLAVQADGKAGDVRVIRSDHPQFTEAVLKIVARMRFAPAQKDGRPVAARIPFALTFHAPPAAR